MKVVYVITRADAVGGASVHVRDLARAARDRGHETFILLGGTGEVTDELNAAGLPYQSLRYLARAIHPLRDLQALEELIAALRALHPDLVSTHTAKAGLLGRAAARKLGLPAIYTPHGWSIGSRISPVAGPLFGIAERIAARWASRIICVCEAERELALAHQVAPPEKLAVVYNGMPDIPPSLLARPGAGPPRICSVARFEKPKDHETLLQALATLSDLEWQLDLVGDGPLLSRIKHLAASLGLAERVQFLGFQRDPAATLAKAKIFALSSRSEAFPRSILEAMRAGLPVVASDVGGIAEAVRDGVTGILVPAGQPDALAGALRRFLQSDTKREHFGAAARLVFTERFQLNRMVDETLAVYAGVKHGLPGSTDDD